MKAVCKFAKAATLLLIFSFAMLIGTFAATPREMYENGVVSDGEVTFGDIRDGIVSDVSEGDNIINGDGTGIVEEILGPITTDMTAVSTTEEITSTAQTTVAEQSEADGMAWGIIIAVIVVVAVIIVIFLLMPKRK